MKILTPENKTIEIDNVPDRIDEDIMYSVLDLSNRKNYDFYFHHLFYLESFNAPAVVLNIGGQLLKMPCIEPPNDWKILVGEPEIGNLEAISLEDLNSRDFMAFVFNPISSYMHGYRPIKIVDTYSDIKWFMPQLPTNFALTAPLSMNNKPECVHFVNGVTGRKMDYIEVGDII